MWTKIEKFSYIFWTILSVGIFCLIIYGLAIRSINTFIVDFNDGEGYRVHVAVEVTAHKIIPFKVRTELQKKLQKALEQSDITWNLINKKVDNKTKDPNDPNSQIPELKKYIL